MNIKLFCINCTKFLEVPSSASAKVHQITFVAGRRLPEETNGAMIPFHVMLQIFRSKGFITMSRAGEICEACKSWGGELLRNGATCSGGECDPGTKAQSWAQKRDNKSTIESQWLGAVVASGQLRDKGRNFGAGCFQATMPVTQHTHPDFDSVAAVVVRQIWLRFCISLDWVVNAPKLGGAPLAQWYQFFSVLVLRSVTLKRSTC